MAEIRLAAPPQVLKVDPGDTIRVTTEFDYVGPSDTGTLYTALYRRPLGVIDEIADKSKTLSIPDSPEPGNHITAYVDITIPQGFPGGLHYGLYSKIMGVPGEPRTENYDEVIDIYEPVARFTNVEITSYTKR